MMSIVLQLWKGVLGAEQGGSGSQGVGNKRNPTGFAKVDLPVNFMDTTAARREMQALSEGSPDAALSSFVVVATQIQRYMAAVFAGVKKSKRKTSGVIVVASDWSPEQQKSLSIMLEFFKHYVYSFVIIRCAAHVISLTVFGCAFAMFQSLSTRYEMQSMKEWQKQLYNVAQLVKWQHQNVVLHIANMPLFTRCVTEVYAETCEAFKNWRNLVDVVWTGGSQRSEDERQLLKSVNFNEPAGVVVDVVLSPGELRYFNLCRFLVSFLIGELRYVCFATITMLKLLLWLFIVVFQFFT